MKKSIVLFFVIVIVVSCAEKLIEKPSTLIPKAEMVAILKDMAIFNAARTTNMVSLKENGIEPTEHIFEKYSIDSITFVENDRYYASQPLEYVRIYEEVEALLLKEKGEAEVQKKINDSLNLIVRKKEQEKDSMAMTVRAAPKVQK